MEILTLDVQTREPGSARTVRSKGQIPCNFYGLGKENKTFSVDYQTFRRVYNKAGGNTVIELNIDGKDKTNVLIHDIDQDPVTDKFTHIDFIFVDLNKEVTTDVPLVPVGESKAVRELSGTLMLSRDTVTVKCMAKNIPHSIEFDISPLEDFNSSLHISDIKLPEGVEILDDEKLTVATVVPPRAEEEEEVPEEETKGAEETEEKSEEVVTKAKEEK